MKYSYTKKNGEVVEKEADFDVKAYNTDYYQKNKERLNERLTCACGLTYVRSNLTTHKHGRVHTLYERLKPKEPTVVEEPTEPLGDIVEYSSSLGADGGLPPCRGTQNPHYLKN
jgi:hypothetical protein